MMAELSIAARSQSVLKHCVSFNDALRVWVKVALLSFGGPTAQIAVMHRVLVEEEHWVSENRFLHALNYCMLLPGPEAKQLAVYIGWLMHRTLGGIVAGALFVVPGAIWFALHTIFREVRPVQGYGLSFDMPVLASVNPWALALSVAAVTAIFRFKAGMIPTLAACCCVGIVLYLAGLI